MIDDPIPVREYQRRLIEKLAEAAYSARFSEEDFALGYQSRWANLPEGAKACWRRVGAAVHVVSTKYNARWIANAGGHQVWCGTYGRMLGWNDAEIHRLEPFMLKRAKGEADSIIYDAAVIEKIVKGSSK